VWSRLIRLVGQLDADGIDDDPLVSLAQPFQVFLGSG